MYKANDKISVTAWVCGILVLVFVIIVFMGFLGTVSGVSQAPISHVVVQQSTAK
jgi:hypothetical protein